jgi:hypothetical protein
VIDFSASTTISFAAFGNAVRFHWNVKAVFAGFCNRFTVLQVRRSAYQSNPLRRITTVFSARPSDNKRSSLSDRLHTTIFTTGRSASPNPVGALTYAERYSDFDL